MRDLLDALGIKRATIVGHSLGGGWRLLAAPGIELVLPVIAPIVLLGAGNRVRSWLSTRGLRSPLAEQFWGAYSSLYDPPTRAAFFRTLRSVVDYRGQSVSALSRLRLRAEVPTLVVWGDSDRIIPVEHGYGVRAARPESRLEVLAGLGHFPHIEAPAEFASTIEEFIAGSEEQRPLKSVEDAVRAQNEFEIVVGVLTELRGCSPAEALEDFTDAIHETGVSADDLGQALPQGEHQVSGAVRPAEPINDVLGRHTVVG